MLNDTYVVREFPNSRGHQAQPPRWSQVEFDMILGLSYPLVIQKAIEAMAQSN